MASMKPQSRGTERVICEVEIVLSFPLILNAKFILKEKPRTEENLSAFFVSDVTTGCCPRNFHFQTASTFKGQKELRVGEGKTWSRRLNVALTERRVSQT